MAKKPRPRCANCDDETSFPPTADPGRVRIGWCVNCWRVYTKGRIVTKSNQVLWADGRPERSSKRRSGRPYYTT